MQRARTQEVGSYNFRAAHPFRDNWDQGVGHFTQVVWRSTMVMGCGMATKAVPISAVPGLVGGCKVVVCRYLPAGNVATDAEFRDNGTSRRERAGRQEGKGREWNGMETLFCSVALPWPSCSVRRRSVTAPCCCCCCCCCCCAGA